jgi:hypothetical protein
MSTHNYNYCVQKAQDQYALCNTGDQKPCIGKYTGDLAHCISPSGNWPACVNLGTKNLDNCLTLNPKNVGICTNNFHEGLACAKIPHW